jgi:Autoinducer binding domain.
MDISVYIEKLLRPLSIVYDCDHYSLVDENIIYSSYPQEWLNHYKQNNYANTDFVHLTAQNKLLPFSWGEFSTHQITTEQRNIFREARDFNINAGITIPLIKERFSAITLSTSLSQSKIESKYKYIEKDLLILQCLLSNGFINYSKDIIDTYSNYLVKSYHHHVAEKAQQYETLNTLSIFINQSKLPPHTKIIAEEFIQDLKEGLR